MPRVPWMQRKATLKLLKPLPCPFCGRKTLYVGHLSAMSFGVECTSQDSLGRITGCRAAIEIGMTNRYPRFIKGHADYEIWLTNKAIARWNRRVK